jgi:medium-chain acyl-[acyl-carrier-protein] hydrolase
MDLWQFEKEYLVHVYETGTDGRLSLWSMFNYMQDIASEHAVKLGFGRDDLMKKNQFWMLSRMYVVIYEIPSWNETVIVKTWPGGTDKLFAMRYYEVRYPDGKSIAAGSSSWLVVDLTTKRIQRPWDLLSQYNSDNLFIKPPVRSAEKIGGVTENCQTSTGSKVRISDLDINLHTNNANYIKWIVDSYDLNFILTHSPHSAEINYLSESMHDEDVIIKTSMEDETKKTFNHSVFRTTDNKELCRIRLEWTEDTK